LTSLEGYGRQTGQDQQRDEDVGPPAGVPVRPPMAAHLTSTEIGSAFHRVVGGLRIAARHREG